MVHVLAIHSTNYADAIASAGDAILAGCACSNCGSTELKLTDCWVERGFQIDGKYLLFSILLARCVVCKSRERVLPFDLLPGKVNGVANIFDALADVYCGATFSSAAIKAGVSRQCVQQWRKGIANRYLDLERLLPHRAIRADDNKTTQKTLVMFSAFLEQARLDYPTIHWAKYPLRPTPSLSSKDAAFAMDNLLQNAGGAREVAQIGASLFRQSVLLFRTPKASSPICGDFTKDFIQGARNSENKNVKKTTKAKKPPRLLALRTNRANMRRRPDPSGALQNHVALKQYSRFVAFWTNKGRHFGYRLPLVPSLQTWRARSPPNKTTL